MQTLQSIAESWCNEEGVHSTVEILDWIHDRNQSVEVEIRKIPLEACGDWYYDRDEGCIRNRNASFFSVSGFEGEQISQPILIQAEIGYLGIICREINGVMHFLMQAKIEPGNVNKIQISPTIQATKSNFTQKHGGQRPAYLEYFLEAERYEIVVDQIQSEQSSRFFKKRNRNILIRVDGEIPVLPSHHWMTLGQLKRLMREDNLVNMDTRTVLSCIPFTRMHRTAQELTALSECFRDKALFRSVFFGNEENAFPRVFRYINDQKMFAPPPARIVPLHTISDWEWRDGMIECRRPYPFRVVFCDISIEGREVRRWTQPLFEAAGVATFGLVYRESGDVLEFLVHAVAEAGCFDILELGPTVQREAQALAQETDAVSELFFRRLRSREGVMFDHLLSEEGGRFYHEQNRNVLMRVETNAIPVLPAGYFWLDYRTLNDFVQVNNVLNIQLRNLLSLLEA